MKEAEDEEEIEEEEGESEGEEGKPEAEAVTEIRQRRISTVMAHWWGRSERESERESLRKCSDWNRERGSM